MALWFLVALLATWRITHLLVREAGPAHSLARVRGRLSSGPLARLLGCFDCLSLWVALPLAFAVAEPITKLLLTWPALSGGAILLDRWTRDPIAALHEEERTS